MRKRERMCEGGRGGGDYLCEGKWVGHRADEDLAKFAIQI